MNLTHQKKSAKVKVTAMILSILVVFSCLFSTTLTANAQSDDIQYASFMNISNYHFKSKFNVTLKNLDGVSGTQGTQIIRWTLGNTPNNNSRNFVYDITPFGVTYVGDGYRKNDSDAMRFLSYYDDLTYRNITMVLKYGFMGKSDVTNITTNEDARYAATQVLLWQLMTYDVDDNFNSTGEVNYLGKMANRDNNFNDAYNALLSACKHYISIPSFTSTNPNAASTYTLKYNVSNNRYEYTLQDKNGRLYDFEWSTNNSNIKIKKTANTMIISSNVPLKNTVTITGANSDIDNIANIWGHSNSEDDRTINVFVQGTTPLQQYSILNTCCVKVKTETTSSVNAWTTLRTRIFNGQSSNVLVIGKNGLKATYDSTGLDNAHRIKSISVSNKDAVDIKLTESISGTKVHQTLSIVQKLSKSSGIFMKVEYADGHSAQFRVHLRTISSVAGGVSVKNGTDISYSKTSTFAKDYKENQIVARLQLNNTVKFTTLQSGVSKVSSVFIKTANGETLGTIKRISNKEVQFTATKTGDATVTVKYYNTSTKKYFSKTFALTVIK